MDFGRLARGGRNESLFWLENPGKAPVEVSEVKTSCDCFKVVLQKSLIAPAEKIWANAIVDFAKDLSFTGSLRLEATGVMTPSGGDAFAVLVDVKIE
jgi:hypothetical protein